MWQKFPNLRKNEKNVWIFFYLLKKRSKCWRNVQDFDPDPGLKLNEPLALLFILGLAGEEIEPWEDP